MITTIVLDMGNVCCVWDPKKIANAINAQYAHDIVTNLFQSDLWRQLDAGFIRLDEARKMLQNDPVLAHALDTWHHHFVEIPETTQFIKNMKDHYNFYLLSNCSEAFYDYYKEKPIFQYFKGYYLSCDHHLLKPDPSIYIDFLKTYQLKAEECLFIDDVFENVEAARTCGMQALQFDYKKETLAQLFEKNKTY